MVASFALITLTSACSGYLLGSNERGYGTCPSDQGSWSDSLVCDETRKYRITLCLAEQGLYHFPFRGTSWPTAPHRLPSMFLRMPNWWPTTGDGPNTQKERSPSRSPAFTGYELYCRTFVNDEPNVFKVKPFSDIRCRAVEPTKLIKASLQRWRTKRKDVEAKILNFPSP
jgi:hypothetical protein